MTRLSPRKRLPRRVLSGVIAVVLCVGLLGRLVPLAQAQPHAVDAAVAAGLPAFVLSSICIGGTVADGSDGEIPPPCPLCLSGVCVSMVPPAANGPAIALPTSLTTLTLSAATCSAGALDTRGRANTCRAPPTLS